MWVLCFCGDGGKKRREKLPSCNICSEMTFHLIRKHAKWQNNQDHFKQFAVSAPLPTTAHKILIKSRSRPFFHPGCIFFGEINLIGCRQSERCPNGSVKNDVIIFTTLCVGSEASSTKHRCTSFGYRTEEKSLSGLLSFLPQRRISFLTSQQQQPNWRPDSHWARCASRR